MEMLGIVLVWTGRRRAVELQPWIVQFLKSDLAGVKTHNGIFTKKLEKLSARFLAGSEFCLISERFKQLDLPRRQEQKELHTLRFDAACVQPRQTGPEVALQL